MPVVRRAPEGLDVELESALEVAWLTGPLRPLDKRRAREARGDPTDVVERKKAKRGIAELRDEGGLAVTVFRLTRERKNVPVHDGKVLWILPGERSPHRERALFVLVVDRPVDVVVQRLGATDPSERFGTDVWHKTHLLATLGDALDHGSRGACAHREDSPRIARWRDRGTIVKPVVVSEYPVTPAAGGRTFKSQLRDWLALSSEMFERRGTAPRPRRLPCEFCGTPLVDPIEEPWGGGLGNPCRGSPQGIMHE